MERKKAIKFVAIYTVILVMIISAIIYFLFFSMARLPEGEFLSESKSADGKYTIKTYLCNGGATVDYAVRGELLIDNKKAKNIYWDYQVDKADINWEDNNTVIINGKTIELPNGKYDWRNDK